MSELKKPGRWEDHKIHSILKKVYVRFLKIRGEPREIALGFALGLFVGMTPVMGFHTLIAVFMATLFKWNKISAALAVWITNPVTAPLIYGATYLLGAKTLGLNKFNSLSEELSSDTFITMIKKTPEIIGAMSIGGFIIAIPLASIGYYFAYTAVNKYQEDIKRKLAEQKVKHAIKAERRRQKKRRKTKRKPPTTGVN